MESERGQMNIVYSDSLTIGIVIKLGDTTIIGTKQAPNEKKEPA